MDNNNFYYNMYLRYKAADHDTQLAGLEHWQKVRKQNILENRFDLYIMSSRMIAVIELAMQNKEYDEKVLWE